MDKFDVTVIGTACCDIIFHGLPAFPSLGEEVWTEGVEFTAGGAMNTSAALARLGLKVGLATPVGNDFAGRVILEKIKEEGVSTKLLMVLDQPYPQVSVALNFQRDRAFVSYADRSLEDEFQRHALQVLAQAECGVVHFYASSRPGHTELMREAKKAGAAVSLDTGWDPEWLRSEKIWEQIALADLFFPNLPEARLITGRDDPYQALEQLSRHAPIVVIKLGEKGALCRVNGQVYHSPAPTVTPVDATGAGDCFIAGFLYGWINRLDVEECLTVANYCGAASVGKVGGFAGAPTEAMVRRYLAERRGLSCG